MTSLPRAFKRALFIGQIGAGLVMLTGLKVGAFDRLDDDLPSCVVRPGDHDYDRAREDDNARLDFRPGLIAYCESPDDVARSVRWASKNRMAIAMRSGGHDYEGFSLNNKGIVIDLSRYQGVAIAAGGKTATIRAGTDLGTMYHELANAQRTLPGGTCPSVAVAGLTTGGGYGMLVRRYGLMCDRLRRVTMVDAKGRLRDSATDTMGEDILWANRGGGGGSFGLVTDLEFDLLPMPESVVYFSLKWAWDSALVETIVARWMKWGSDAPRELTSVLTLAGGTGKGIHVYGQFLGPESSLMPMIEALRHGTTTTECTIDSLGYIKAVDQIGGHGGTRQRWKMKSSLSTSPLSPVGIHKVVEQLEGAPQSVTCILEFDTLGGAVGDLKSSATAFPHRDACYSLQYQTYWGDSSTAADDAFEWIRTAFAAIDPYTAQTSYRNYSDLDLADWQQRYFGDNYPRLQRIKAELDPKNLFHFPQSIALPSGH